MKKVLITGSGGLIGSEAVRFFAGKGFRVYGIDNDMRRKFFGKAGSTDRIIKNLEKQCDSFINFSYDVRDRKAIGKAFGKGPFDLIIHCAAQPSHDWGTKYPVVDFDINAGGTVNLLEAFRQKSAKGVFIYLSTVKVYGDAPNEALIVEKAKRYEYKKPFMQGISNKGITEEMRIDQSHHSIFGAAKTAGDVMAQEYGKHYGLKVGIFRSGCLTAPHHSAVEMHGYLVYLIDCVLKNKEYTVFGYQGKQVRDQLHSKDVISALYEFFKRPKKGEVYNLGGGNRNAISILETFDALKERGYKVSYKIRRNPRIGDQKVCVLDNSKFTGDFPNWKVSVSLDKIIDEIIEGRSND